jgi:hypothetical protein
MSGRAQHFDKQDQRRIDQDWMTGFDNRDRLAQLQERLQAAQGQWETLQKQKLLAQSRQALEAQKTQSWHTLLALHWSDIDQAGAQAELQQLQTRLAALLDPQSGTVQAQAAWQAAQQHGQAQAQALLRLQTAQATWQERQASAQTQERLCRERLAATPAPPGLDTLHGPWPPRARRAPPAKNSPRKSARPWPAPASAWTGWATGWPCCTRTSSGRWRRRKGKTAAHSPITRKRSKPWRITCSACSGCRRKTCPPSARFQDYLNQASDQGVSTLLSGIEAQVAEITERIDQLNQTLARVDFHSGRYLQLVPQPVLHPSLQQLHQARAQLRSERLQDDGGQRHYQALRAMVELLREHASNRRTKAAQALLDARYRLQFAVHVLDRATGQVLERRTGSQGGSGGEKEIIASYVLTASLSYALCPPGAASRCSAPSCWTRPSPKAPRPWPRASSRRCRNSACTRSSSPQQRAAPAAPAHPQRRAGAPPRRASTAGEHGGGGDCGAGSGAVSWRAMPHRYPLGMVRKLAFESVPELQAHHSSDG